MWTMRTINRSALSNCNIPLLPHQKYVAVTLLTGDTVYFVSEIKGRCQELFDQICNYLVLSDSELFSLAIRHEGEYVFVETGVKIYKYAPKTWKSRDSGLDASGKPLITFHFRVHLYVDCHLLINDKIARNHYYLQLKENVCNYCQSVSEERSFLLAAYALQADLGNFQSDKHSGRYFEPAKYFNNSIISKLGEEFISLHTPVLHLDNAGLIKAEAQINFMKEASNETAQHNLHFYKMRRKKGKQEDVWLGISQKTLQIYEDNGKLPKTKLSNFAWGDITKIHFEKKKFEICCAGNPKMRKFSYYLKNEIVSKSLFWLCRLTHQFNMAVQPRIAELKKYELEATVPFRESYIYSDSSELHWLADRGIEKITPLSLTKKSLIEDNDEQRKSVISNASSNTTSGIVSDRDKVQCLYESEDELETSVVVSAIKNVENHFSVTEKEADCVKVRSASRDGGFFESKNEETKVKCDKQMKFNCVGSGLPVSQPECSKAHHSKDAGAVISQVSSSLVLKTNAESVEKSTFQTPVYEPKYFMLEEWNAMNGPPLSGKASSVFALPSPCLNENMINSAINCNVQYPVQRTARTVSLNNADSNGFPIGVQTLNRNQSRNVTRIGVSSLTKGKTGRVPLSLYCNGQSGSEPELNHLRTWSSTYSIDSEHSLPPNMIPGKYNPNAHRHSLAEGLLLHPHSGPSITWHSNLSIPSSNYSTLNSKKNLPLNSDLYVNESRGNSLAAYQSMEQLKDNNQNSETNNQADGVSPKQSQSQLDIHQLWKTSQHMELPLLAGLCNDRSLMLPKTVATCSRQRHSVAAKDLRRFSCSYLSTPLDENMYHASNFTGSQTLGASRQSSTNNQNCQSVNGDIYQANKLGLPPPPAAFSAPFGCSSKYARPHSFSAPPEMLPAFLPPPILTSFGKTQPSKSNEGEKGRMRDSSIDSCQEFPMSLSSHTSCLPNQKGIYKIS